MIRSVELSDIEKLRPLLEEFYLEQRIYIGPFHWDHIKQSMEAAIPNPQYIVLTDTNYKSFFMGYVRVSTYRPVYEGYDLFFYVHSDKRGSPLFIRLLKRFEQWCTEKDVININLGVSSNIMDKDVHKLYTRCGYNKWFTGFRKEVK